MSIEFEGVEEFNRLLNEQPEVAKLAAGRALYEEANNIMASSKVIVPHDLGALADSGDVSSPEIHGDAVVVELGYGGPATPYAIIQHEDMSLRHDPGRTAKYLERPVLSRANDLGHALRARIAQALFRR